MTLLAWRVDVDGVNYLCAARSQAEALGAALCFEAQQPDHGEGIHWPAFTVRLYNPRYELPAEAGTLQAMALLARATGPCVLARAEPRRDDDPVWSEA